MLTLYNIKQQLSKEEETENMNTSAEFALDGLKFIMGKVGFTSDEQAPRNGWSSTAHVLNYTPSSSLIKNMGYQSFTDLLNQNTDQKQDGL